MGAPVAAAAKRKSGMPAALAAFVGGVLVAAGVFTPWVRTVLQSGVSGWKVGGADARADLGLAAASVLLALLLAARVRGAFLKLVLVGIGIAAIAISVVDIRSVQNDLATNLHAAIGVGLILTPAGGAVVLLTGLFSRRRKQPASG
jgi:hypothetical protein